MAMLLPASSKGAARRRLLLLACHSALAAALTTVLLGAPLVRWGAAWLWAAVANDALSLR